jgi:hypothetical protein
MRRLLLAACVGLCTVSAEAAQPVPFEGFYEASVQTWKLPGDVDDVSGLQIVRIEKTCTAWRLAAHFNLRATSADGHEIAFETKLSGTESLDGTRYQFRSENLLGGQLVELLEGEASRPAVGKSGVVQFTKPEARTSPLPRDAVFPVASFLWSTQQWERGQKTANYVLFDGTTADPVRVFELLIGPAAKLDPPPEGDTWLLVGTGWRSTGSFHRYSGQESEPLSTITQSVLANGVTTDLSLDVGIADVALKLRRLRALPEPKC